MIQTHHESKNENVTFMYPIQCTEPLIITFFFFLDNHNLYKMCTLYNLIP